MKFNNVRLLVRDYRKCFDFYTQKLGFEPLWDIKECYGAFKVADGIEGLAIFLSEYMASVVGNAGQQQPVGGREKSMICFEVSDVDETYNALKARGGGVRQRTSRYARLGDACGAPARSGREPD